MAFHNKVCPQCNTKFLGRSTRSTFCTQSCGVKWRRAEEKEQQALKIAQELIDDVLAELAN